MMLEGFAAFGCSNFMQSLLSPELPSSEDNWDDSQLPEEKKNSQTSKNHSRKIILDL